MQVDAREVNYTVAYRLPVLMNGPFHEQAE